MAFEFLFEKSGITFFLSSSIITDYLSFLKIVHHCSSQIRSNSKGTQKILSIIELN